MKIYRTVVIDIETGKTVYEDAYDYTGPIALCGGGGSAGGGDGDDEDGFGRDANPGMMGGMSSGSAPGGGSYGGQPGTAGGTGDFGGGAGGRTQELQKATQYGVTDVLKAATKGATIGSMLGPGGAIVGAALGVAANAPNVQPKGPAPTSQAGSAGGAGAEGMAPPAVGFQGDASAYITGLYQQYLGRAPDASGMSLYSGWLSSGKYSPDQIAAFIHGSPEAQAYRAGGPALSPNPVAKPTRKSVSPAPTGPTPASEPVIDTAALEGSEDRRRRTLLTALEDEEEERRKRLGRMSTIVTGGSGLTNKAPVRKRTLLGA